MEANRWYYGEVGVYDYFHEIQFFFLHKIATLHTYKKRKHLHVYFSCHNKTSSPPNKAQTEIHFHQGKKKNCIPPGARVQYHLLSKYALFEHAIFKASYFYVVKLRKYCILLVFSFPLNMWILIFDNLRGLKMIETDFKKLAFSWDLSCIKVLRRFCWLITQIRILESMTWWVVPVRTIN